MRPAVRPGVAADAAGYLGSWPSWCWPLRWPSPSGNEVQANTRFDRAHRTLDGVRSRTVAVDRDLVTARADLTTLDGQVTQDSAVLATDTSRLDTALVALTESREDDANQSTAITNLQTCLGGVEKALNALSVGDQPSAVAALEAVATPCSSAVTASA